MSDDIKYSGGLEIEANLSEIKFLDLFKLLAKRILWFFIKIIGVKILIIFSTSTWLLINGFINSWIWFMLAISIVSVRAFEAFIKSGKAIPFK